MVSGPGPAMILKRVEIGQDAISELVEDRSISWGFGTWTSSSSNGYTSGIDYTKIHVGCKLHDDTHQTDLQSAIASASPSGGTPLAPSLNAADDYFLGNKADQDGSGDNFDTTMDCQPKFLITVTDGLGNTGRPIRPAGFALMARRGARHRL